MTTPKSPKPNPAPRVTVQPRSMFGDIPEDVIQNPHVSVFDLPGYSDRRRDLELARARDEEVNGVKPTDVLTHRFQWVRCEHGGSHTASRVAEWRAKGYIPVAWDKADSYGVTVDTVAGHEKDPDGNVRIGDTVLMVCDARRAAHNLAQHEREVESLSNAPITRLQEQAAERGMSATITTDEPRR